MLEIILGPILAFRGLKNDNWHTSALIVIKGTGLSPDLNFQIGNTTQNAANKTLIKTFDGREVWRLEWAVQQTATEQTIIYSIEGGRKFSYIIPPKGKPLRIAYGSCFGFHSKKSMNKVKEKHHMWEVLADQHSTKPFHLMFMGGDQVYADLIWDIVRPLNEYFDQPLLRSASDPFTKSMQDEIEQFYFNLYCERWSQKAPAAIMCQVPLLMMWDDHEIFDGWGSYPKEQQQSHIFQNIYKIAREHFHIFQFQAKDFDDLDKTIFFSKNGFSYGHRFGDLAMVVLDLRSERTTEQVMSPETWEEVYAWIDKLKPEKKAGKPVRPVLKHLLIMSSIPVVYASLNMVETVLDILPGMQGAEDDIIDQWMSGSHMGERLRLIHRLLQFSKESLCRVTIVSGDVHTAALGYIQSDRDSKVPEGANVVNQLISSAMVNVPPSKLVIFMLEKVFGNKEEEIDRGISARLLKFPGTSKRFIGARNWLSLTFDNKDRVWAEWYVEDEEKPYTKVVHPVVPLHV